MKVDINNVFKTIYDKESDAIFRFCLIRVSDREQALDITQETFLRFWQNLVASKKIRNNRAFIFTIAHHLIIDWYRKKKSIPFKDMSNPDSEENEKETPYDPPDDTTEESTMITAEGRYFMGKINELTPSNRDSVYLRFVEDLSPTEIAEILGISTNAVSVRINRGLLELKEKAGYDESKKIIEDK